MILIKT